MSDLTAQEQAAIEMARTWCRLNESVVDLDEAPDGLRFARALLSLHGRLKDAHTENDDLRYGLACEREVFRAELTEARNAFELEQRHSDELSSECEDHAFLVAKVKRVTRHVAGDAGIHSGREFDSLMADVRDLATVTIDEHTQVADTLQRSLTEARRLLDVARKAAWYWKSELDDFRMAHTRRSEQHQDTGTQDDTIPQEFVDAARAVITPTEKP